MVAKLDELSVTPAGVTVLRVCEHSFTMILGVSDAGFGQE
tara:strand:+ start:867 stop:986 length:120 start_codon:yes stop_codon:yes gene_type:complete